MPEAMGSTIPKVERMKTMQRKERAQRATQLDESNSLREPRLRIPTSAHEPETHRRAVGPTNITLEANIRALLNEYNKQAVRLTRSEPEQPAAALRPQGDHALVPSMQQINSVSRIESWKYVTPGKLYTDDDFVAHQRLLEPSHLKRINHFARRHKFFREQSLYEYTISQGRLFERAVYDYARSIKLSKAQAKTSIIHARSMCGEEDYDSDYTRLDNDEVNDSTAFGIGFLSSADRCSSAAQTLPSQNVQMQHKAKTAKKDNTRKRPSDVSENGSGKWSKTKRIKPTKDSATGAQAGSRAPRVIVKWIEIKLKLLTSFENAALHFHQWPVIDPMEEKIIESIRYAANRLTFEIMEHRPVLLQRLSEAFKGGSMEFFGKYPKSKVKTLRHEQNLRSILNTHIDAAMARRIEEKEEHGYGRVSEQYSEDSDDRYGSSRQSTPGSSRDNRSENDASTDYGYDDQPATTGFDRPDLTQEYSSEGVEAADSYVTGPTRVQCYIEQKLVSLIQDHSEKYSHNQLTDETRALLRTAFKAYEKHHASEDETEDDRLLLQKWGDLIRNDSADGSEAFRISLDVKLMGREHGELPFGRFGGICNAWQPWADDITAHSEADIVVRISDINKALYQFSNLDTIQVEDDIQLSDNEQFVEVPAADSIRDGRAELELPAQHDHNVVKIEEQHLNIKEQPERSESVGHVPTGARFAEDEHNATNGITPYVDTPPIPSKCRTCGRVFPSGNALKSHCIFYHGQPSGGLWPDAAERNRKYRLYLHDDTQHEAGSRPLDEDTASVQAQPSEGGEIPVQHDKLPIGPAMDADPQMNQLQCRQCNGFFGSKNRL
ncbi:MAG: hypothetical protein Q9184_007729, partial [Pyrenodesmia sp. 2 TL-2023]